MSYRQKRQFDKATEDCDMAIELDPKLGLAYYIRGEVWLNLKEWDKAQIRPNKLQKTWELILSKRFITLIETFLTLNEEMTLKYRKTSL